jgi:molecular chaperone GrpE (heat shock protein)
MELNKIIKKILREAVGVPEGIVETAELVYGQLMSELKSLNSISEDDEKFHFRLNGDYQISDYKFKKIDLTLEIIRTDQVDKGTLVGMSFNFKSRLDNDTFKVIHQPTKKKIELSVSIAIPEDGDLNSVIQELENEKEMSISSLSHELMHSYDKFKKPISNSSQRADYDAYKNIRFGIEPIDDFLHNLYFTHSIENIVRPSEIAADLKSGSIDKEGFLAFLKDNRVYKKLKEINSFTYEGLKKELLNHVDVIRERLEQSGLDDIPEGDEELVNTVLDLLRINLVNGKGTVLKQDLTTNFFEEMMGFSGKKEEVFRNYVKRIQKYDNTDDFFRNEEKMFKRTSYDLIKKIHKLYSILDKNKKTNESIINWDLYHEIKKTPIVIETELNTDDDGRKVKLIQKYLDNVLVPGNKLICKSTVARLVNKDEYLITIWVNKNEPHSQDDSDNLVDDTWDEIYNMFEVPSSIKRVKSEC